MYKAERYKEAGVDLEKATQLVEIIKDRTQRISQRNVLSSIGGYAGLFSLDVSNYKNPLLVASTDGVGTKIKIAIMADKHKGIGIDLVAMCVNDIITCGAKPLFFLDYIAMGRFNEKTFTELIEGIVEGCAQAQCVLLGGETAEMPGMYGEKEYDLAGFVVGLVDREKLIDGSEISFGDIVIGISSSGLHSNGFSLVRKIIFDEQKLSLDYIPPELGVPLGEALLIPTKIYVTSILTLMNKNLKIKGVAHITGGGFFDNIPRILPKNCKVVIEKRAWEWPPIFKYIQDLGKISENEMYHVFNCGIGMILIVDRSSVDDVNTFLRALGESAYVLGQVEKILEGESQILLV
ncbi:MAG: phosphoribosylformylglycinamidine cyclo-ligase [Caldimicrobium sp.]|nr:phosphoribosylformylglycinamidine cyclo-ligase [Caldimicrobium sp.]MCX7873527.1 phosphoribosylformylglycinamidine cyclo-ligase [Caldimicrobium sp.]MDW8094694.1 phosphoribosylformylglycinamidine cyclo-ligase [Caldimicrobium sp.]